MIEMHILNVFSIEPDQHTATFGQSVLCLVFSLKKSKTINKLEFKT